MIHSDNELWTPLTLSEVKRLFRNLSVPWWVAGGVALDMFAGYPIRPHNDIDVGIFRDDQLIIQQYLLDWNLHKTNQPGLSPWMEGEFLPEGVNQVWCRRTQKSPWSLEIMFIERDGDEWFFRREPRVRGAVWDLIRHTTEGIPYLSPEIQLLFKARAAIADKDALDFNAVLPHLDASQMNWLCSALKATFPAGHAWIDKLR